MREIDLKEVLTRVPFQKQSEPLRIFSRTFSTNNMRVEVQTFCDRGHGQEFAGGLSLQILGNELAWVSVCYRDLLMERAMADYRYYTTTSWTEGRNGSVSTEGVAVPLPFSAPPEFQGEAGAWTPEHFFAAALGSCFVTTFKAIADLSKFEYSGLQVEVEAVLQKEQGGYSFTRVIMQPILTIASDVDQERGIRLLEKAERSCLISRSVKSQIELQPKIMVQKPAAVEVAIR